MCEEKLWQTFDKKEFLIEKLTFCVFECHNFPKKI